MGRKPCCDKVGLRRGAWTMEEDQKLINFILINGIQCWRHVPKLAGLKRCGKSCRLRWTNYLRPDLKRGSFTEAEEDQIIQLHSQLGNRWSKIASHFPGRTDNEIKNHWNTGIKKRLKLLGVDPLTHNPLIQHPGQDSSISGVDDDEVNKTIEITDSQEDQHVQHLDLSGKDDKKQNSTDEMLNLRESQEDQHVQHLDLSGKDDKKQNSTDEMLNLRESLDGGGGEQMQVGEAKPSSSSRSSSNSFISMDDTHNSTNTEVTELCWDVPIDSLPSWEELYFLSDLMSFVDYP